MLATQIRCHTVEVVLMSRNPKRRCRIWSLDMSNEMRFQAEASSTGGTGGGNFPVCIKDYAARRQRASGLTRADAERYNPIPGARESFIDKAGKVRHIHFLSAYPEQEKVISDALKNGELRPYERNGQRLEVETAQCLAQPPAAVLATRPDSGLRVKFL